MTVKENTTVTGANLDDNAVGEDEASANATAVVVVIVIMGLAMFIFISVVLATIDNSKHEREIRREIMWSVTTAMTTVTVSARHPQRR